LDILKGNVGVVEVTRRDGIDDGLNTTILGRIRSTKKFLSFDEGSRNDF
jgi:hypothetical protein